MKELKYMIGTVAASAPEYGVAVVYDGVDTALNKAKIRMAFIPTSCTATGAGVKWAPVAGDSVAYALDPVTETRAYLIGPANYTDKDLSIGNEGTRLYDVEQFSSTDSEAKTLLLNTLLESMIGSFSNRGHYTDRDQYPGDYLLNDNSGQTGLMVGKLLSQLRGSPLSYVEVTSHGNQVTILGESIAEHTFSVERKADGIFSVHNVAISPGESLGAKYGTSAIKKGDGDYDVELKDDRARPLFRLQSISGRYVDGEEQTVIGSPDTDIHTEDTEPPVLSRRRAALSGELSEASALGVLSVKTPYIPTVLQTPYTTDDGGGSRAGDSKYAKVDKTTKAMDAAVNRVLDALLDGDYLDTLVLRLREKGLVISSEKASIKQTIADKTATASPGGPTAAQSYELPPSIDIIDPITGLRHTYYASTSFISQEPNGDILLADGYGSEIRMSMGNIYISPALDCFIRPGRDLSVMAGRHQAYNSQNTCTINTSKGMFIKASTDLKIAGAMSNEASGNYAVTIESGADSTGSGGIVIHSNSGLSVTGTDVYIGRNKVASNSNTEVADTGESGGIVIDAGAKGTLNLSALTMFSKASELTFLCDTSSKSCLCVSGSSILMLTQTVGCSGDLLLASAENITVDTASGATVEPTTIGTAEDKPRLMCQGDMYANGNLKIDESCVIGGSVVAKSVGSTNKYGTMGYVKEDWAGFDDLTIPNVKIHGIGIYAAKVQSGYLAQKVYNDNFIKAHAFCFPDYRTPPGYRMPGMIWQTLADRADIYVDAIASQGTWKESYIQDIDGNDTAVYPGVEAWETGVISTVGYTTYPLKTGYRINVLDKEND